MLVTAQAVVMAILGGVLGYVVGKAVGHKLGDMWLERQVRHMRQATEFVEAYTAALIFEFPKPDVTKLSDKALKMLIDANFGPPLNTYLAEELIRRAELRAKTQLSWPPI